MVRRTEGNPAGGALAGALIGGTCPVLVTSADTGPLDRWNGTEPLRLTVATDGSAACESVCHWIRTFKGTAMDAVSLVRSYWPPQEAAHYGMEEAWLGNDGHPELLRVIERDLRRDARALAGAEDPRIRFTLAARNAGEAIAEDVRQLGTDAMVIGVPAHRRFASTGLSIASVLRSAPIPVFCIPAMARPKQRHIPKVQSVLIAFDRSEMSRAAILPAYGLLLGGGRAELCYVHERGPANALDGLPSKPPLTEDERATIDSRLRAAAPYEAAEHGIVTHTSVLEGLDAAEVILQAAERLDVDVIALGSRGRSGIARALLGSVAEQVARRSTHPGAGGSRPDAMKFVSIPLTEENAMSQALKEPGFTRRGRHPHAGHGHGHRYGGSLTSSGRSIPTSLKPRSAPRS